MKRYLGVILLALVVLSAGVASYRTHKARAWEAEREANFSRLQREYLERVGWMRANPDEKGYKDELAPFLRRYFQDLADHRARFDGDADPEAYLAELAKRTGDDKLEQRKAFYEYTRRIYDQLEGGKYAPVWSATDKGMRLDVVSASNVQVLGKPQIRLQLVLWGAQRELKDDGKQKRMATSASFTTTFKLTDAKGKLIGEMNGGDPSMKVDYPERFVPGFPPQMVLGHYDLDPVPAEVANVEIVFGVSSQAQSGGSISSTYTWKQPVPDAWKLEAGEKWEGAVESERPEEEIDPAKRTSAVDE